jgi:hypothetical protein
VAVFIAELGGAGTAGLDLYTALGIMSSLTSAHADLMKCGRLA